MKEFEYSELFVSLTSEYCLWNLAEFLLVWIASACIFSSRSRECLFFAACLRQTSPPKIATSPSKKGTSPPLRLGKTGGSPGGSRPPILSFCWGLDGVSNQNTSLRLKKGLLGPKKEKLPAVVPVAAGLGFRP
ncbi:hypothetical protein QMM59_16400 [Leptospira santarosai]|nr:hypothetical protein [Leptospira santarosai]MDI7212099.1 hypothetical protein [Leptospira santarosai]